MPRPTDPTPKLSPARRRWLNKQVSTGRFSSVSAALDYCVQQAAKVDAAQAEFDRLIAEGDAGPFERVNDAWWASVRAESDARRRTRARRKSA